MKTQAIIPVLAAMTGIALSIHAQTPTPDFIINTFDAPAEASEWARWWGSAVQTYEHDAMVDANANPSSGSLKVTVEFNQPAHTGDNQFAAIRGFTVRDASVYTNLVFDLRWDSSSPTRPYNDHGFLEYGFRVAGFQQSWLGGRAIPLGGNWIHFEIPISPTLANIGTVSGVVLKMWAGGVNDGLTGTAIFWLDNVKLIAKTDDTPIEPPTLSIAKPEPGLNLLTSHATDDNQRQGIRTVSTNISWIDQFAPVTYSMTISKFPDSAHSGFQAHMFLAPPAQLPFGPGDAYLDWNAPNVIFWQIANNADGSAYTRFSVKTNQPSGNSQWWNPPGMLALIGSPTPLGRWSLTINSANEASITTPNGSVTNFTIPSETAAIFANAAQGHPLYAWFGGQPNNVGNMGQQALISGIEIIREFDSIEDDFTGPSLDLSKWAVVAAHAPGVAVVPPDAIGWLRWTLPDVNFTLQQNDDLGNPSLWGPTTLVPAQIGDYKRVLLTPLNPGFQNAFFRMEKPAP